ncbi:MAG: hypothetical protein R6W66_01305 [Pelovirga sp.]
MKTVLKLIGILLLVVIIAVAGAVFYIDVIAKKGVERGGEIALGVPTRVANINLSLFGGEGSMNNLQIANPAGFSDRPFMELGVADMAVTLNSLLGDQVMIPRVALSGIRINLEQQGGRNNVSPLLARARSLAGESAEPAVAQGESGGKKFTVAYFVIDDVAINASLDVLGQQSSLNLVLPKIELRNLGAAEQGLTLPELIEQVVQVILSTAQKSSAQLSPALSRLLSGELSDLGALQADLIGQAQGRVDKAVGDLEEKLQLTIPEEEKKKIEDKAGELLRGIGGRLGGD